MSYQWYKTLDPNNDGDLIQGEISQTYTPSTSEANTTYYYVVVTNTNDNVNGDKSASTKSNVVKIAVTAAIKHLINFYDENLDFIESIPTNEGNINPSSIKQGSWYKANETLALTNHDLNESITLYAVPNVQEITDQDGLNKVRNGLGGKYILLNDIFLDEEGAGFTDSGWNQIGSSSYKFTGIFNGNGNKITNLWINKSSTQHIGLFSYINKAQIRNLGVEITAGKEIRGTHYVGGIAGYIDSSNITNSYSIGTISANNTAGNDGMFAGGITGFATNSNIINVYSNANVSSFAGYVGGIAGYVNKGKITGSYSTGNISAIGANVGGIAGYITSSSTVQNNAAINPSVNGSNGVNRIVGLIYDSGSNASNNFALDTMEGSFSSGNTGTPKAIAYLKQETTYRDAVDGDGNGGLGWKFGNNDDNPWKIDSDGVKNNGYPYFYWQDL